MKKHLLDLLICPSCLPKEQPLKGSIARMEGDDIISGYLKCTTCGTRYPIDEGVALLLIAPHFETPSSQARYESAALASAYLWSHYADLFADPEAGEAYSIWASHVTGENNLALDAGCAVGRLTFELSAKSDFVVGVDTSTAFIRLARQLMREGSLTFSLITEGHLSEPRTITLPEEWKRERVEFIVGDALALPFPLGSFSFTASLNLLDKVPKPLQHLLEMNRVAGKSGARFLFSDPFSWSEESARAEDWLGGKKSGEYAGEGLTNVRLVLQGAEGVVQAPWNVEKEGTVRWKIRNHRNHYEMIRSEFILFNR